MSPVMSPVGPLRARALRLTRARRTAAGAVCGCLLAGCGAGSPSHPRSAGSSRRQHPHRVAAGNARPLAPVTLSYRPLYSLPAAVQDPGTAAVSGNEFVLMGGIDVADTSTAAVLVGDFVAAHQVATLPNPQHDAQAADLGGRVYLFGGGQFSQYDHVLAYYPATGTVTQAGTLPQAESDVAVAGDGRTAYVVGGFNGAAALDTVVAWRPGAGSQVVAHLPVALRYAAVAYTGGALIIAGGSTPAGTASDAVYRLRPFTGALTRIATLPEPLTHAGAAVLGGIVYLVGGRGADLSSQTDAVLGVNPVTGAVRRVGRLPQPLSDAGVVALGDAIVVAGGRSSDGAQAAVGELAPAR